MKKDLSQAIVGFLEKTIGQNDVSLVIAKDSQEISQIEVILKEEGFQIVKSTQDLIDALEQPSTQSRKLYVFPDHENAKDLYDFIVQYPTGQVEISDTKTLKPKVIFPKYYSSSIVVLVLKEELQKFELNNLSFLQHVGLTFQN